jgi:hypothetical protein
LTSNKKGGATLKRKVKAMIAFLFLLFLFAHVDRPASAESTNIKVTVHEGFDGKVKRGKGFPLSVKVENSGKAFSGYLLIDFYPSYNTGGSLSIQVELPENSSKIYKVSLPGMTEDHPSQHQNLPGIHLYKGDWKDGKEVEFKGEKTLKPRFIDPNEKVIGVLTENIDRLKELKVLPSTFPTQTLQLEKDEFPIDALGLEMVDYIVVDEYALSELEDKQQEAIKNWIQDGGVLIAGASPDASASYGSLYSLLPMKPEEEGKVSSAFLKTNQKEQLNFNELPVFTGRVEKDAAIIMESSSKPVVVKKNDGNGMIIQTGFSLGDQPLSSWKGYGSWFSTILKIGEHANFVNAQYGPDLYDSLYYEFAESNEFFPASHFSIGQLIALLIGYIVMIVPVLYFILRKLDKREHSWWIIPVIAISVSASVFGIGAKDRLAKPQLNQMGFYKAENGVLSGYQAATLLSNTSGTYQLSIPNEQFHPVSSTLTTPGMSNLARSVFEKNRNTTDVFFKDVEYWSSRTLYGKAKKEQPGSFETDLTVKNNVLSGTIKNHYPYDFEEIYILSGSEKIKIGFLKKNDTVKVNQKIKQSVLIGPGFYGAGNPPFMHHQQTDMLAMKKERLENAAGTFLFGYSHSENKPVIAGLTNDAVISVKVEGKTEKQNNLNLIMEPFTAKSEISGPFTLTNESLKSRMNVITGQIIEKMQGKNEMMLEDGEYEYILSLPEQVGIHPINLEEINIRINGQFVKYEMMNQRTGEYMPIDQNNFTLTKKENVHEFLSKDKELVLKLKKQSGGDPHVFLPTIKIKGEVAR